MMTAMLDESGKESIIGELLNSHYHFVEEELNPIGH
jgi:hypothetical protein